MMSFIACLFLVLRLPSLRIGGLCRSLLLVLAFLFLFELHTTFADFVPVKGGTLINTPVLYLHSSS